MKAIKALIKSSRKVDLVKKAFYLIYLLPIPFFTTWFDLNRVPYTSYFLLFATLIMGLLLIRLRMSHIFHSKCISTFIIYYFSEIFYTRKWSI